MEVTGDLKAVEKVRKIKAGGAERLSIAQITALLIDLPNAQRNLTPEEFDRVARTYDKFLTSTHKLRLNLDQYHSVAAEIIAAFDALAPYEKYSGKDEADVSAAMALFRESSEEA